MSPATYLWRFANDVRRVPVALVVEIESRSTVLMDRSSKPLVYAEAGIPAYWRVERDGTAHIHKQHERGEPYKLAHTARPGDRLLLDHPFPVRL